MTASPRPSLACATPRDRDERIASIAILAAVFGFLAFIVPAMRVYPGGTAWDRTARGSDFWLNSLCDLQRRVARNGESNPTGSALAQMAMLLLAIGLGPLWWRLARLFPDRRRLGAAVRGLGGVGVVGSLAVGLLPSDRFGDEHAVALVLGGGAGLLAAGLAVVGLAGEGRRLRVPAVIGAATALVSSTDFLLYVGHILRGGADLRIIAVLERLSVILVLLWMCAIADA